ncbi:hypothetical protein B0A52_05976 [Exophiala mesophila]|uniref:SP-RING-type domain-containing protein n=1 Tax=Exophiala mesophila TaxID=212818 RepID=A0A438N4K4_EXOME|nr:hypothetical protein B0A52_05976 [Exophiala mesophila]
MATTAGRRVPSSTSSRSGRASARPSSSSRSSAPADFVPQRLALPLSDAAQLALADLLKAHAKSTQLTEHLALAIKELTDAAAGLTEAAYDRKRRYDREERRRKQNGEQLDEQDIANHEAFQTQVQDLTQKMDMSIREVIDDRIWLEDLPAISKDVLSASLDEQSTQRTDEIYNQSPTPIASTRDTEMEKESGEHDSRLSQTTNGSMAATVPTTTPHSILQQKLQQQAREWQGKTLTERYAYNNDYAGWKREVHDNQDPQGEGAPLADAKQWFAAEEGRGQNDSKGQRVRGDDDDESEDEIEISRERLSYKCPLTLLPFEDPLTSTKCNHSYEKEAILDMLRTSADHVPLSSEQEAELGAIRDSKARKRRKQQLENQQERRIQCPECRVRLVKGDLQPNPILKRRVLRYLAAQRRAETATSDAEASEDEGRVTGTQRRPVGLGSSPVPSSWRQSGRPVKAERHGSTVPQTQFSSGEPSTRRAARSRVVDMDELSLELDDAEAVDADVVDPE